MSEVIERLRQMDGTHLMPEDGEAIAVSDIIIAFAQAETENIRLRAALAMSKDPCVYCQYPLEEMAKCPSGFPGCARADDMMGCPEMGAAATLHTLRGDLKQITEMFRYGDRTRAFTQLTALVDGGG
jgi:hypothetical protein